MERAKIGGVANYLLLIPGIILSLTFVILPLAFILQMSLYTQKAFTYEPIFTLENYMQFLTAEQTPTILYNTFSTAFGACIVALLLAYPLAYFLTFSIKSEKVRTFLIMALLVQFLINYTVRTVGWLPVLGEQGFAIWLLKSLGLVDEPIKLLFNRWFLTLLWVQGNLMFMMFPIQMALARIDPDVVGSAKVLKAPPHKLFYHIIFKLSLPGVVCGFIFVFVTVLGDYASPSIWGGGTQTLGLSISQYAGNLVWPYASTLSVFMIILTLIVVYILVRAGKITKLVYE